MSDLAAMAAVLGIASPAPGHNDLLRLADAMQAGLPTSTVDRVAGLLAPDDTSFKYRLVPKATLTRSRSRRLSPAHSERVGRYARLWATARDVWKSDEAAREFLWRRHPLLEGRRPIEVAETEVGARLVEDILGELEHGTAA